MAKAKIAQSTKPTHWSNLRLFDEDNDYHGSLGFIIQGVQDGEEDIDILDGVVIENGQVIDWKYSYLINPNDEPYTDHLPVNWKGFQAEFDNAIKTGKHVEW